MNLMQCNDFNATDKHRPIEIGQVPFRKCAVLGQLENPEMAQYNTKSFRMGQLEMNENTLRIQLDTKNADTARSLERMIGLIDGAVIQGDNAPERADLLIYELGPDTDMDMSSIQSRINQGSVGEVFLVSEHLDPNVLLKAMRLGVKEVLATPFNVDEVNSALLRCQRRREELKHSGEDKIGKLIYVIGSKGGVGCTTISVNLALGLKMPGQLESVGLIDSNVLFGEIPLFLGMRPRHHWGEIAKNAHRMDRDYLKTCLHSHPSGMQVLAAPRVYNIKETSKEDVMTVFSMMKRLFDYVVVDGGQQLGELSTSLLEISDQILIISTQSLPCLANTNRILESFYDIGCLQKDRVKIIMNRYLKKSEISLKDAEESLKMKVFWSIPNDYPTAVMAINRGQAVIEAAPSTTLAGSLRDLAEEIAGRESVVKREGKGFLKQKGPRKS